MAASIPVVIASNQTAIPITGSISATISPVSSDYYPMYNRQDLGKGQFSVDPSGALVTRGAVTTDEGFSRVSFTGSALTFSPGSATLTNGSSAMTGSGFTTTDVHFLDYVKLSADAESAYAQVSFVNTDTSISLFSSYTGTGGTGAYVVSPVATSTGTGATISVGSGALTMALGTNTSASTSILRGTGDGNGIFQTSVAISQRVANQDIYIGYETAVSSPIKQFSRFHFTSTTNTQVITETGYNPTTDPSASEKETNTITLPAGAVTSSANTYRIEQEFDQIIFYVNGIAVATHLKRIPHVPNENGNSVVADIRGTNSGAVTNTNVVVDYMLVKSFDRLDASLVSIAQGDVNNVANVTNIMDVAPIARYNATLPTITDTQYNMLQVGSRGAVQANLLNKDSTGELFLTSAALADTASAVPVTTTVGAVPLLMNATTLDRIRSVINATDSVGTGITAAGVLAQFDDTSPGTVTENRFGNLRMSVRREMYTQIRDAAGNERGVNVDANNNMGIVLPAETTKVVGTVRNLGNAGAILDAAVGAATAPTNMIAVGGLYNSTEISPSTGQSASLQLDSKGRLRQVIMDAAGNTRGANVDANSNLGVVLAAETTKVLGVTRTADGAGNLLTTNSTTYTAKFGLDGNLLGTLGTAFSTAGKVDVKGADGDVFVRQTAAANLNATVVGQATGSAVPSTAFYNGGNAQTSLPAAATAGNLTGATYDKFGRQVVVTNAVRDIVGSQTTTISNSTSETTIVTSVAATFLDITAFNIVNTSATAARIDIRDATSGSIITQLYAPAGDMRGIAYPVPLPQTTAANNWTAQSSAAVVDLRITVHYIKNK